MSVSTVTAFGAGERVFKTVTVLSRSCGCNGSGSRGCWGSAVGGSLPIPGLYYVVRQVYTTVKLSYLHVGSGDGHTSSRETDMWDEDDDGRFK